jgi:hypothetical protein
VAERCGARDIFFFNKFIYFERLLTNYRPLGQVQRRTLK